MWNNFNRWAAEYSPGEQKLVSLFLLLLSPLYPSSALKDSIIDTLLQANLSARHAHIHACIHTRTYKRHCMDFVGRMTNTKCGQVGQGEFLFLTRWWRKKAKEREWVLETWDVSGYTIFFFWLKEKKRIEFECSLLPLNAVWKMEGTRERKRERLKEQNRRQEVMVGKWRAGRKWI